MAIILPILTTFNAAGVRAAQSELTKFGGALTKIGQSAIIATAGFKSLNAAIDFIGESITSARDLERNMAALSTVFGTLTPRMEAFSKNAANIGLSQVEAARTSVFLGSVLKQAGFSMEDVADNTENLTKLAQDLATTFGYDTSEALTAMTALFRGEYDPIEKFGVALKQQEVNALLASKGMDKLTGQALLNAQQQVRLEQLFIRSADAMGAYERQAGTLFVAQKNLNAAFENMKALAGGPLTNDLASVFNAITPTLSILGPQLEDLFGNIGDVMVGLEPLIAPLMDTFGILIEVLSQLAVIVEAVLTPVMGPLADVINIVNQVLHFVLDVINALMPLVRSLAGSLDMLGLAWDVVAFGLENVLQFLKPVTDGLNKFFGQFFPYLDKATTDGISSIRRMREELRGEGGTDETDRLIRRRLESLGAIAAPDGGNGGGNKGGNKTPVRDAVKEFYSDLADEVQKQNARLVLTNRGLSKDLIESIIGAGEDWQKVFNKVKSLSATGVANLQKDFNKTAAGFKEILSAYDTEFAKLEETYKKQKQAYDEQVEAINNLKKALKEVANSTKPLAVSAREIGQFEQAVINSFSNIASSISAGLADGTLLKEGADRLTAYAKSEQGTIQELMRQRDVLVGKRSAAQALMDDIKSTIMGMGNVTELLAKNTTDVTQTITKMVGNVQVATSKVIKGVTGGSAGLVASFTETLAKTKAFAQQLKDLRALGLDSNIYQQIVSAGVDAGGATAKAILEGGSGTVSELNSLFTELSDAGAAIAEEAAQVMYGSGIDLIDGLINGLISKEQLLVDKATEMARNFSDAFNAEVAKALPMPSAPSAPVYTPPVMPEPELLKLRLGDVKLQRFGATVAESKLAAKIIASPKATAWSTTINVNAGVGTDGKQVGQAIYSELLKFAKSNGIKV